MSIHFREECECGRVITQCRCASKDKSVRVVGPCPHGETGDLQDEDLRPEFMRGTDA